MINYYKILNIPECSNILEIKKGFRVLALKYHPDKNNTEYSKSKFIEIKNAYDFLSDPKRKEILDKQLRQYKAATREEDIFAKKTNLHDNINKKYSSKFKRFAVLVISIIILFTIVKILNELPKRSTSIESERNINDTLSNPNQTLDNIQPITPKSGELKF